MKDSSDLFKTRGFINPMKVGSKAGDSFKPPTYPARGGPPRDPIGNIPGKSGRKGLPVR